MLTETIDAYLATRRAAGFELKRVEFLLRSFARFAVERGDRHVRQQTAIEWAALGPSAQSRDNRLGTVIRFARHARAENNTHEVPPEHVFAFNRSRRVPYIYSPEEIRQLLEAATHLGPTESLRPHTYRTLIGLLATTGLRVSEALGLCFDDLTDAGLVIRKTKFSKERLVPLHSTTEAALHRYMERRRGVGGADEHVFVSLRGQRCDRTWVLRTFWRLLDDIGLYPGRLPRRPRLHDLRFTFAVRALEACPEDCEHIGRHALALATYMGHSSVAFNFWYLQSTPPLMTDVADACESFLQGGAP